VKRLVIIALFVCSPAIASDFSSRVVAAKQAAMSTAGTQYDAALGPHIAAAMQSCIPPGSTDSANLGSFRLVGYVASSGALMAVEFQPQTKVSACFAGRFRNAVLPAPPRHASPEGYPIVVEMQVTP
jgi:hypothetical protein